MKVLIINGSPRTGGNTSVAVREMEKTFLEEGLEVEVLQIGNEDIRGCVVFNQCAETGKSVFDDIVNTVAEKFEKAGLRRRQTRRPPGTSAYRRQRVSGRSAFV